MGKTFVSLLPKASGFWVYDGCYRAVWGAVAHILLSEGQPEEQVRAFAHHAAECAREDHTGVQSPFLYEVAAVPPILAAIAAACERLLEEMTARVREAGPEGSTLVALPDPALANYPKHLYFKHPWHELRPLVEALRDMCLGTFIGGDALTAPFFSLPPE